MIGWLRGEVIEHQPDGRLVLNVAGVGYEVLLSCRTQSPAPPGTTLTLWVHTHVREDALQLFAFADAADREIFRLLLGVASIGPKLAAAIVGHLGADGIHAAIAHGDKHAFRGISGVGKKTVERLLIDLKDKCGATSPAAPRATRPPTAQPLGTPTGPLAAVQQALVAMGYRSAEAEQAVARLSPEDLTESVAVQLRRALAQLG